MCIRDRYINVMLFAMQCKPCGAMADASTPLPSITPWFTVPQWASKPMVTVRHKGRTNNTIGETEYQKNVLIEGHLDVAKMNTPGNQQTPKPPQIKDNLTCGDESEGESRRAVYGRALATRGPRGFFLISRSSSTFIKLPEKAFCFKKGQLRKRGSTR